MKLSREFSQGKLIAKDSLGICARVTFKWLALEVAGGKFKYDKLNVAKSSEKMAAYGDPFIQKLCHKDFSSDDDLQARGYVQEDMESTAKFVNLWGQRIVDEDKKEFKGIKANEALQVTSLADYIPAKVTDWKKFHAMYNFYMKLPASFLEEVLGKEGKMLSTGLAKVENVENRNIMAGHVVGISGSTNTFFDANVGLHSFEATELPDIAEEIDKFIQTKYSPGPNFRRSLTILGM